MFILEARNIVKTFGLRTILEFDSLHIYEGDRIGVVGANGAGKSTLLGILSGEIAPDFGAVERHRETVFLHQFDETDPTRSGGENRKDQIRSRVDADNLILFADEPTANLDAQGIAWVRRKLESAATLMLVSHDRALLDQLCTRIVEVRDGGLNFYTGNYSDYLRKTRELREEQELRHREFKKKEAQLKAAVAKKEAEITRQKQNHKKQKRNNNSEARLGGHKRNALYKGLERQAGTIQTRIDKLEQVDRPKDLPTLRMDFSLTDPPGNKRAVQGSGLDFSYGERPIFKRASFEVLRGERLAVSGPNGSGKSTLLRLIYDGHLGISKAPKLKLGFLYQDFRQLKPEDTVLENVLSTSVQSMDAVYSALAGLLFVKGDVHKKAEVLSGGEKIRLSLAKLILSDVNAMLLDEPTNYLDIPSLEALKSTLLQYPGTILLVSHDSRFVEEVATRELVIEDCRLVPRKTKESAAAPPDRMLLELRRTRLVQDISSAPADKKPELEREYHKVLKQLSSLG